MRGRRTSRSESPSARRPRRAGGLLGDARLESRVRRSSRASLAPAALCWALGFAACSSSDDVVAVYDADPTAERETRSFVGSTSVGSGGQPVPGAATGSGAAEAGTSAPIGAALPVGDGTPASAGPPPAVTIDAEALRVIGIPASPPRTVAERWPLDTPLQEYFSPPPAPAAASQAMVLTVREPDATPLRELGAKYGLGEGLPPARVRVEDQAGDQFELTLWED